MLDLRCKSVAFEPVKARPLTCWLQGLVTCSRQPGLTKLANPNRHSQIWTSDVIESTNPARVSKNQKQQKNNYFTEMCSGSEEGSYSRRIVFCITQF